MEKSVTVLSDVTGNTKGGYSEVRSSVEATEILEQPKKNKT